MNEGERRYFDNLVASTGSTWWGDKTAAAAIRIIRRVQLLRERLAPAHGATVLEIGCGVGNLSRELARSLPACQLVACDISEAATRAAHRAEPSGNLRYLVADCSELPVRTRSVDFVVGRSILHHVPNLSNVLVELNRVLAPGGKLFFSEPNPRNPHTKLVSHFGFLRRLDQWSEDELPIPATQLRAVLEREAAFIGISVYPYDFVHPATPLWLAKRIDRYNDFLCSLPGLRHLAGSLIVTAEKPRESAIVPTTPGTEVAKCP